MSELIEHQAKFPTDPEEAVKRIFEVGALASVGLVDYDLGPFANEEIRERADFFTYNAREQRSLDYFFGSQSPQQGFHPVFEFDPKLVVRALFNEPTSYLFFSLSDIDDHGAMYHTEGIESLGNNTDPYKVGVSLLRNSTPDHNRARRSIDYSNQELRVMHSGLILARDYRDQRDQIAAYEDSSFAQRRVDTTLRSKASAPDDLDQSPTATIIPLPRRG